MKTVRTNPDDRRRFILARATDIGHIGISDLADQMNVSMETVRRDLAIMESHGLMRRTHGGAYPVRRRSEDLLPSGGTPNPEMSRIAAAAADIVAGATSVYLDEGEAVYELASIIAARRLADPAAYPHPLTVHTPSLAAASSLATAPSVEVVVLGGRVRPDTLATVDTQPTTALGGVTIDLAVMAATGVSVADGATTNDPDMSAIKASVVVLAHQRVLLAPQSAYESTSAHRFARIGDFDLLITGSSMLAHEAKRYAALGPRVIRV